MMEEIYRPAEELKPEGKLIGRIGYKPNASIIFVLLFGAAIAYLSRGNIAGMAAGFMISLAAAVFMLAVRDHPVMSIYEKDLVIFNAENPSQAQQLHVDDLTEFFVSREADPEIHLRLNDGSALTVRSFQKTKAYALLAKVMPESGTDEKNLKRKFFFRS